MSFIEKLESEIEQYFHRSGAKEGFDTLQNDFNEFNKQRAGQFEDIKKRLEPLQKQSTQYEIKIPTDNGVKDACFQQVDSIMLIGVASKNQILAFTSLDNNASSMNLISMHTIQFTIDDNPNQYTSYPKHKQKIVNFVKSYRQNVFPKYEEDLFCCNFLDLYMEENIYTGIVAGGVTGFIHFVDIQTSTNAICFQVHGDAIFDIKSLNREQTCYEYKNIVVSASKDGCIFLSHVAKQEKLVQLKDFLSTSPMSQVTCIDVDMKGERIFSSCGDGTIQIWQLSEQVKKILQSTAHVSNFIKVEKAAYNYQVQAQEDLMHTVQVTQCNFYGKLLLYLTSQGYITLGTNIEPHQYKTAFRMRKFDKDFTGKSLKFFQMASFDLESKVENYYKIMHVDQKRGLLWVADLQTCQLLLKGKGSIIHCFDLKERKYSDIDYNYSKALIQFDTLIKSNILKMFFNDSYTALYLITDTNELIKFYFSDRKQ